MAVTNFYTAITLAWITVFFSNNTALAVVMKMLKFVTAISLVKGLGNVYFKAERGNKQNKKSCLLGQFRSVKWFYNWCVWNFLFENTPNTFLSMEKYTLIGKLGFSSTFQILRNLFFRTLYRYNGRQKFLYCHYTRQNYIFFSNITVLSILMEMLIFVTAIALVKGLGNISFKIERVMKTKWKIICLRSIEKCEMVLW